MKAYSTPLADIVLLSSRYIYLLEEASRHFSAFQPALSVTCEHGLLYAHQREYLAYAVYKPVTLLIRVAHTFKQGCCTCSTHTS